MSTHLANDRKTFSINYRKSSSITLANSHDKIIEGLEINNSKTDCLQLINCYNLVVQNCRFISSKGIAVNIYHGKNIVIKNCYFESVVTDVYALKSTQIKVINNKSKNVLGPFPWGQLVQFDRVYGPGNRINFNRCENLPGESNPEDVINMYKSSGVATDPIQIIGNWIRGGGPSITGGGIMLGDKGGSYIIVKNNILVNPGQYGIAIAGGTNLAIISNLIFSKRTPVSNVGIYVWNQYKYSCAFNIVKENTVNWTDSCAKPNCGWNRGNCGTVDGWKENFWNAKIDSGILPAKIL